MSNTVAKILGALAILGLVGMVVLAVLERAIPDPLSLTVASSVTGLLGLLARPPMLEGRGHEPDLVVDATVTERR